MNIRHFAGYGTVKATKVSQERAYDEFGCERTVMTIKVEGDHEQGLKRDDVYDAVNWLLKKFDKSVQSYSQVVLFRCFYEGDACIYKFAY